jgi:hypothetical protein
MHCELKVLFKWSYQQMFPLKQFSYTTPRKFGFYFHLGGQESVVNCDAALDICM